MHRSLLAAALLVCGVGLGACSDEPPPVPPQGQFAPSPSEESSLGEGNWRPNFTRAELAAFEEALARWQGYQEESQKYFRRGKATDESRRIFEDYFYQGDVMQALLESYEKRGVKVLGEAQVLWTRAGSVALGKRPPVVVIEQCINVARTGLVEDKVTYKTTQRTPVLRTITLSKVGPDKPWQIFAYEGPETKRRVDCEL